MSFPTVDIPSNATAERHFPGGLSTVVFTDGLVTDDAFCRGFSAGVGGTVIMRCSS